MDIQIVIGEVIKLKGKALLDIYVFTWMSKKLSIVALSTCEDEYVVASSSVCEAIWLKNLLKEFDHSQEESIIIYVDNKSAIELPKNPV